MNRRVSVPIVSACLTLLLASPPVMAGGSARPGALESQAAAFLLGQQPVSQGRLQEVIRLAYSKLERYMEADGLQVELRVDDFRTILREGFDKVQYLDLISPPDQTEAETVRITMRDPKGKTTAAYRPTLVKPDPASVENWIRPARGKSFREILDMATDEPRVRHAQAVTTFRVRREVAGQAIEYRAAFIWLVDSASPQLDAYPLDFLTEGVARALGERHPPAPRRLGDALRAGEASRILGKILDEEGPGGEGLGESEAQCNATSSSHDPGMTYLSGGENHNSGGHALTLTNEFTCTCESNCTAYCDMVPDLACQDTQDISGLPTYHNNTGSMAVDWSSTGDGLNVATYCVVGAGCAVRECLTSICGLSVTVGLSGQGLTAGVTLQSDQGTIWSRTTKQTHTCPKCQVYTPPPPPPPSGGGGGGDDVEPVDGEGGDDLWYVDCGSDGTIDYYFRAGDESEAWDIGEFYCWGPEEN